jgi:glycosyltransferase involved in cell wall biosynthesis
MKVLHVIPNLFKGGAQRLVIDICNELSKYNRIDCKLLVLSNAKNEFLHISESIDITYVSVEFSLSILSKNKVNISPYEVFIDEFQPDIIHSHLYFSELICHEKPRKNITYITHFHNNIRQLSNFKFMSFYSKKAISDYYEKKRLLFKYKKSKKLFITISENSNQYAKNVLTKKLSNKIKKLENAILHYSFVPIKKKKTTKTISLVSIGNLLKNKNQIFLLYVLKNLISKGYNTSLTLVGEGSCRDEIINKAHSLSVEKNLNMVGAVNYVQKYLWESNFYVHSAISEAFGLVLIESMASRTPVISYNGGGNKDVIKNNETGILINELDPKKFANAIITLFEDNKLYDEIVEKAFSFSKKYDIKKYVVELIKIYKK